MVIAVLGVPLPGESLTGCRLAGLSLSVAGIGIVALVGADHAPAATLGALLPLASTVAIALYAVLCRRAGGVGSLATVTGATFYSFPFLLPGALPELMPAGAPAFSGGNVAAMVYPGLGCSAASFLLLLSVVMLGEALTPARVGGA